MDDISEVYVWEARRDTLRNLIFNKKLEFVKGMD
jgi:hypothetical protein